MGSDQMRVFRRAFAAWPSYVDDSQAAAWQAWLSLAEEERLRATAEADRYAQACRTGLAKRCAFGVYLRERRWESLPPAERDQEADYAPPFGPVWGAFLVSRLLIGGPDNHVDALYRLARFRRGHRFGERWHELKRLMEPVPTASETFRAWKGEFERRNWPWPPDPGDQRVVYFPAGGPDGLAEFEAAVRSHGEQAHEAAE